MSGLNKPVNSNVDFLLDIEATGLPSTHFLKIKFANGKAILPSIDEVVEAFAGHVILQFGYSKTSEKTKHLNIVDTSTGFIPMEDKSYISNIAFSGGRKDVKTTTVRKYTHSDILSFLKKSNNLETRQIDYYMEHIAPTFSAKSADTMYEIIQENDRILYTSRWSAKRFLEKTPEEMAKEVKGFGFKEGETFFEKAQSAFLGKEDQESLYQLLNDVLEQTEKGTRKTIGALNATYDINFIRYVLDQSGNQDLLYRFEKAVEDGSLMISSVERDWQLMAYKLAQENPDIAESFKIGYHPEAFEATGGRFGKVAQTFEEFQNSTLKWNSDNLTRYFGWDKKVSELSAAHHAGADVDLTRALMKKFDEIKSEALDLAKKAGLSFNTFEELATSKTDAKIMENAIANIMNKSLKGKIPKKGIPGSIDIFKKLVAKDASDVANFHATLFPSYIGSKLTETTRLKLGKFGGISAAIALLVGSTYMFGKKETSTSDYGNLNLGKNIDLGTDLKSKYTETEAKAHVTGEFWNKIVSGMLIPASALYAVGAMAKEGHLLGYKEKIPEGIKDLATSIGRTVYHGLRKFEANVPLARLFRAQSIIEYNSGSRRTGLMVDSHGKEFYKGTAIPVIRDGHYSEKLKDYKLQELIKAANVTNPKDATLIEDFITPKKGKQLIDKATLRIASMPDGKTIVFFDRMDSNGKAIKQGTSSVILDLEAHVASFKIKNMLKRPGNKSAARYADELREIKNTILIHKFNETRMIDGIDRVSFTDYLSKKQMPGWASKNEFAQNTWESIQRIKYELDMVPKGVGEGTNELRPKLATELYNAKKMVIVKKFLGDNRFTKEGLQAAWNFRKHPIREFTIHSINTFLETPFEMIGAEKAIANVRKKALKSFSHFANMGGKVLSFFERPHLGLDTVSITHGLPEYLFKFAYKRLLPAAIGIEAIRATDHLLGWATFSPTGRGPIGSILTGVPQVASLMYSKISDIFGLTNVAKRQEAVAPGSTGLGILAPALSLATIYKMGEVTHRYGSRSIRELMDNSIQKFAKIPFVQKAMRQEAWKGAIRERGAGERFFSWAIKNPKMALFAAGLAPTIPFWPGLIGSNKSYQERKAEYSGQKEVAIRKARGWLLSSSPFSGENTIQYRRHGLNLAASDWENRGVIWSSYKGRLLHNLTLGLYDKYGLEKYHAKDQPVYQSAGYGAGIPLIGPIIAATIGRIIKPTRTYHLPNEGLSRGSDGEVGTSIKGESSIADYAEAYMKIGERDVGLTNDLTKGYIENGTVAIPGMNMQMMSQSGVPQNIHQFQASFSEFAGFKGFFLSTMQSLASGKKIPDEYVPYAENADKMYNPANQMWAYNMGDISVIGGEFLRRLFQNPTKKWEVNNIPNELYGQSWIPHDPEWGKDYWKGTTYNQIPMGWLYASRKGWEFLYPTMKDVSLDQYPDPIRLEILKGIAPQSPEFNAYSAKVGNMAMANQLDPYQEQRYYNTVGQVRDIKNKVYAHMQKYTFEVPTEAMSGKLTELDLENSEFTVNTDDGLRKYRLAGISTNLLDIRARLLKQHVYKTVEELDQNAREIQDNLHRIIQNNLEVGDNLSFQVAGEGSFSGTGKANEAIVGSLNNTLLNKGAPLADTGALGTFNMAQKQVGAVGRGMAKYWNMLTDQETFWDKKLISDRDYLGNYLSSQVYNREVKLWSRPIEHLLKPALASTLRHFGVEKVPNFTRERRDKQQYWDVIKYIKYKMLAKKAQSEGDSDRAHYYHNQWRRTMVGANPLDHSDRDTMLSMPSSERNYFRFFANEPDPKKRAQIYKFLPAAEKRLYKGIWTRELAKTSGDSDVQEAYQKLAASEGWELNNSEERRYLKDASQDMSRADWARASFISEFSETHALPGLDWEGWDEDVNLENVEIETLKQQGEQTEDYGFFENKVRQAAFDSPAFQAAIDINSIGSTDSSMMGTILPYIAGDDYVSDAYGMPTSSANPIMNTHISTNGYMKTVERSGDSNNALIHESMYRPTSYLNGW